LGIVAARSGIPRTGTGPPFVASDAGRTRRMSMDKYNLWINGRHHRTFRSLSKALADAGTWYATAEHIRTVAVSHDDSGERFLFIDRDRPNVPHHLQALDRPASLEPR
jgi:hypothetical protein